MSQSAEGVSLSELTRPVPGRTTKVARVWELVSEILRVIVSREPSRAETSAQPGPPTASSRTSRRRRPRRSLFHRAESETPIPPVWQDVQARALTNRLHTRRTRFRTDDHAAVTSDCAGEAEQSPPVTRAGEIDWSPFLVARMNDDFARPPVLPD